MRVLTFALALICAAPTLAGGNNAAAGASHTAEAEGKSESTEDSPAPLFGRRVQPEEEAPEEEAPEEEAPEEEAPEEEAPEEEAPEEEAPEEEAPEEETPETSDPERDTEQSLSPQPSIYVEQTGTAETDLQTETQEETTEPATASDDSTVESEVVRTPSTEDARDVPNAEDAQGETSDSDAGTADDDQEGEPDQVDEVLETIEVEVDAGVQEGFSIAEEAVRHATEEASAPITIPPPNLSEPPAIPGRATPPPLPGTDENDGWRAEITASTGLFVHASTDVGFYLGAGVALVEYGPQTRPDYMTSANYARRDVWGVLQLDLGFEPNVGLDETEVVFALKGVRTEVTAQDESESAVSEIRFGPIRYQRALSMDRELDLTVSVIERYADRRFAIRDGAAVRVTADVEALGYEHIRYTPLREIDHYFNGVRALAVDLSIAPEFAVGEGNSQLRYIAGFKADVAVGSRDGSLLTMHSDMSIESGVGGDIAEWVTWSGVIGYRSAIDSRRPNRTGWYSTIRVIGRLP